LVLRRSGGCLETFWFPQRLRLLKVGHVFVVWIGFPKWWGYIIGCGVGLMHILLLQATTLNCYFLEDGYANVPLL